MPDVFTSDGVSRPNELAQDEVTPMVAPALPLSYQTIGECARVGVLNDYAVMLNSQLAYWTSATPHINAIDRSAAYPHSNVVSRINDIINTMAAACAEEGILNGAGMRMFPYISIDYNSFTTVMSKIRAQLSAMQQAKP